MKVQQAKVCSFCDELYDYNGQECPVCLGRNFAYARAFLPPLSAIAIKEVQDDGTIKCDPLQMVSKTKPDNYYAVVLGIDRFACTAGMELGLISASEQSGFDSAYSSPPPTATIGKGNDSCGIKVESTGSVFKRSHWLDASFTFVSQASRVFQRGSVLSSQKY